jgi:hypothetical protein
MIVNNIHSSSYSSSRKRITTSFDFPAGGQQPSEADTFQVVIIRKGEYQLSDILFGRKAFRISKKVPRE